MRAFVACGLAIVAAVIGAVAGAAADQPRSPVVAKVYGCQYEDSCTIDYRADRNGRGVWIIRRAHP